MQRIRILGRNWGGRLQRLIQSATTEILISSPFVTHKGTHLVVKHVSARLRNHGTLNILTDLSPTSICQGSTDPDALQLLSDAASTCLIHHLPRLHAKVYIADQDIAIISSGNLTAGGLYLNYEYGIEITDRPTVSAVRDDVTEYAALGVAISGDTLIRYCAIAHAVQKAWKKQQSAVRKAAQREFDSVLRGAEDALVRLRLAGGAMHTVFEKTILYLLRSRGALRTVQLHPMIQATHPELCDDTIDRVIDGKRFGKKWKHAVRTAQQQAKKKGLIRYDGKRWHAARVAR